MARAFGHEAHRDAERFGAIDLSPHAGGDRAPEDPQLVADREQLEAQSKRELAIAVLVDKRRQVERRSDRQVAALDERSADEPDLANIAFLIAAERMADVDPLPACFVLRTRATQPHDLSRAVVQRVDDLGERFRWIVATVVDLPGAVDRPSLVEPGERGLGDLAFVGLEVGDELFEGGAHGATSFA